jgi:hypothetical protein
MVGLVPLALWMIGIDDKEGMKGLRPLEAVRIEVEKIRR